MAISTDATLQDFFEVASHAVAEVRSSTSGSGDGRNYSALQVAQDDNKEDAKNLGTGVVSAEEVPFQITRDSARKIAELTSDDEYESLVSQRRSLVHKQFDGRLSREEVLRLRLIEWTLDCVEKSRDGSNLDSLQQLAKAHEAIAARVARTAEQLEAIVDAEAAKHKYRRSA